MCRCTDHEDKDGQLEQEEVPVWGPDQAWDAPNQNPCIDQTGQEQADDAHKAQDGEAVDHSTSNLHPVRGEGSPGRPEEEA